MRIGVAGSCGADTGIQPDEDADEVWGKRIGEEICEMGVLGGWRVA